jgi:putative zinc finger/helix-turn-helix YgiT family protein
MDWPKSAGSTCPACGNPTMTVTSDPLEERVCGRTYAVEGFEHNRCEACGEEFFLGKQLAEIGRRVTTMARADLGRLGGEEIASLRHDLGLTQAQLEARLGVSPGLVGRWERGTVLQSAMADRYLRDLRAHPELVVHEELVARESRGPYRRKT